MLEQIIDLDIYLFWLINSNYSDFGNIFFHTITQLGNGWVICPMLLVLVLFKTPRHRWVHVIILVTVAISLSGILNSAIKRIVKRPRPITYFARLDKQPEKKQYPNKTVHIIGKTLRYRSFPSGHTNTAFCAATAVFLLYGGSFAFVFLLALLTAYSRVYLGVHFPFDTLVGGIWGLVSVWLSFYLFKKVYPPLS